MNKSSLAEAMYSPVWLKLIVLTGHLRKLNKWQESIILQYINKSSHCVMQCCKSRKEERRKQNRRINQTKTYSSFVNVRTQSICDISHKLTNESALPTAKYLLIVTSHLSFPITNCRRSFHNKWSKQLKVWNHEFLNNRNHECIFHGRVVHS